MPRPMLAWARRLLWFVGLWVAGTGAVALVGLAMRLVLA
jgi:hypothetical protein